jgi:lysophospholipase L1-like esterase
MLKNIALCATSAIVSIAFVVFASEFYAHRLGILDREFRYEVEVGPWTVDREIGFINRADLSETCCGNVRLATNSRGFRQDVPTPLRKADDTIRIVGVGDSVMWGAWVEREDAWLGVLERELATRSGYEVINAGVIGYSTYQERLFLERHVLPLAPDVVVVNHCDNDFLPTEDPFGNASSVLSAHLDLVVSSRAADFSPAERAALKRLREIFASGELVWPAVRDAEPIVFRTLERVFVDSAIVEMVALTRAAGARLVFVFVPPRASLPSYPRTKRRLQRLLRSLDVEVVDLEAELSPDDAELQAQLHPRKLAVDWIPIPALRGIQRMRNIERVHRDALYIDRVHLTRRGNAIAGRAVAERLHRTLAVAGTQPI